jgi:hypothetical protein
LYDIQIYLDCILRITQEEFTNSSHISYDEKMCPITNRINEEKKDNDMTEEDSVDDDKNNDDMIEED